MPSPFPGMDPFIEDQRWPGFQHSLISQLCDMLVASLRPVYEIEPEKRIYLEHSDDLIREVEEREAYLVIRKTGEREIVTVIEVLSPSNKRRGSDGRREYLKKRSEVLWSSAHLVEIDLLVGGERLPTDRPLKPMTDYCAFVCRAGQRPQAEVFEWTIHDRLPRIPIPLLPGDADAILDLQAAFNSVYDRSGYDYALHYDTPLSVSLRPQDQPWIRQVLAKRATA
jgi:hypothetical protein